MPREYYIAWWNLENLFDVENAADRPEYLRKQLAKELKGWNQQILDKKILQLSKNIKKMNNEKGPDLLGVCEIENERVMKLLVNSIDLPGRNYQVAHHDTKDKRGIDVGFIYDGSLFKGEQDFSYEVLKRLATRDIYQVNFKTKDENNNIKNDLILVGNHWPSRSGGRYESEPYRIIAAETLAYWHSRIQEILGKKTPIIFMGDFNDQPHDRSLTEYALSTREKRRVLSAKTAPRMFNLMWPLMAQGSGTYYYRGEFNMLDQFSVSKGFFSENEPFSVKNDSIEIINVDPVTSEALNTPIRFGRPSSKLNQKGYSDHFPISMVILEE